MSERRSRSRSPGPPGEERERSRSPAKVTLSVEQMFQMMDEREEARKAKDWNKADEIRDELKKTGVQIFDKRRRWVTPDGRNHTIGVSYEASTAAPNGKYEQKIHEREQARQASDYEKADKLREELKQEGVSLFDKEKVWWSTDGHVGIMPSWDTDRGHDQLSDGAIVLLIRERENARGLKDFQRSDSIRASLKKWGVVLYDKTKSYQLGDGRTGSLESVVRTKRLGMGNSRMQGYAQPTWGGRGNMGGGQPANNPWPNNTGSNNTGSASDIEYMLLQRERYRAAKDWGNADGIRSQLRAMGVEIYDKDQTWKSSDGQRDRKSVV